MTTTPLLEELLMARTLLFSALKRMLAASHATAHGGSPAGGVSRREILRLSAAATGALALGAPFAGAPAAPNSKTRVAIIGGGAAGLTAAYRLQQQGLAPVVFEAGQRWGGRMFTLPDFYHGMFAELGGEFVDTRHEDLKTLAGELSLALEPLFAPEEQDRDLYFFGNKLQPMTAMFDASSGAGAFVPIAKQIAADKAKLRDAKEEFTDHARALDAVSLAAYLKQFRGKAEDWAIDLIIDALVRACEAKSSLNLGAQLVALAQRDGGMEVTLETSAGARREVFSTVVLALPFTCLRQVKGLEALGLSAEKLKAIQTLGDGNNAKMVCGTTSRPWRRSNSGLPYPSNGNFYSDLTFQNVWETSRNRPGESGILSNFMAGGALPASEEEAFANLRKGLAAISAEIGAALDPGAIASFFWEHHFLSFGSYACAKTGQYTTLLPVAQTPECDGRLHFAGEHTEPEFLGYMNGAILSGNRAAHEILAS
ncbi:MAG: FAD-dependent oxidoreductase [Rhodomicrobium sp.]|nr:FAD-dependent oxidoreductase [Rhodomicrobium sp.]